MGEPERTADGRYVVVDARRWRATDPHIPDQLRVQLVAELMTARRLVRTDPLAARPRVQDAKVALGERGEPWWEPTEAGRRDRLAAAIRTLLWHREGTICPSEAARIVGGAGWRDVMPLARSVAIELAGRGIVQIQQGGQPVDDEAPRGPIRLARGPAWPAPER